MQWWRFVWLSGAVLCQEIAHVGCELCSVLCLGAFKAETLFALFCSQHPVRWWVFGCQKFSKSNDTTERWNWGIVLPFRQSIHRGNACGSCCLKPQVCVLVFVALFKRPLLHYLRSLYKPRTFSLRQYMLPHTASLADKCSAYVCQEGMAAFPGFSWCCRRVCERGR